MRTRYLNIILFLITVCLPHLSGQSDIQPPSAPLLKLVSVQPETGFTNISWNLSTSTDVAAYVIYSYNNGEGFAFDTVWDPSASEYTFTGSASYLFSESYVVAALDSSANISPLSNGINTIFVRSEIDTCRKIISLNWNKYPDFPNHVTGYKIMVSVNNGGFTEIASVGQQANNYDVSDFETDSDYCFIIRAELQGSISSTSGKSCINTRMQRPPIWINADYASVNENAEIDLSFSFDPQSEIESFLLERRKDTEVSFQVISNISTDSNPIKYTDEVEDINQIYFYRISAINNCNSIVISSNIACNISLKLEVTGNEIRLQWNQYREWNGNILTYRVFSDINGPFEEIGEVTGSDTTYLLNYSDIMYNISGKQVCYYIKALESSNPYSINSESISSVICAGIKEIITVPNAFTPNNDLINDRFKPVLSFTPKDYNLVIRDRLGSVVFETRNYQSEWDGLLNGELLPPDVYLWSLSVNAPSGKNYLKTGTITILNK